MIEQHIRTLHKMREDHIITTESLAIVLDVSYHTAQKILQSPNAKHPYNVAEKHHRAIIQLAEQDQRMRAKHNA